MIKILVLGGTQFIGRDLVETLMTDENYSLSLANRGISNTNLFNNLCKLNIDRNNNLALAYTETIPIAFAAIKEQKIIVDSQASTITQVQTNAETQSSTITQVQTNAEAQSSTITQVQTNAEAQSSTITGLQATVDSQASTIVAILAKYPLDI